MSKIGEYDDAMVQKAVRDTHRQLFVEMVAKTGSKQSVLDRLLQEISDLRIKLDTCRQIGE